MGVFVPIPAFDPIQLCHGEHAALLQRQTVGRQVHPHWPHLVAAARHGALNNLIQFLIF